MSTTIAHPITISEHPATQPGELDGFAIDCAECGRVAVYSIRSMADEQGRKHRDYMLGRNRRFG